MRSSARANREVGKRWSRTSETRSASSRRFCSRALKEIAAQGFDTAQFGVPSKHEARRAADEGVELPAAFSQRGEDLIRSQKKYRVRLDWLRHFDTWNGSMSSANCWAQRLACSAL